MAESIKNFRQRLLAKDLLLGTFVKTPAPIICEVFGLTELDTVCLDAEHAPFDRLQLDACIQALRAAAKPSLVRVAANTAEHILQALDYAATGIVVPHVSSAEQARQAAKMARFGEGGRGYAGSTRAAAYTTKPMQQHLADSDAQTTVIAQIEDPAALDVIDEIAAVEGIDCLFIGRIDLTVALKADSPNHSRVLAAVEKVCAAARQAGKTVGMFISAPDEADKWIDKGASFFLLGSDHTFILNGASQLCASLKP